MERVSPTKCEDGREQDQDPSRHAEDSSLRVTIRNVDGVSHTVEVTAVTLYEAVAQGLTAIQGNEWVARIAEGFNVVKVSVADVRVEHEVKLGDFTNWMERTGGSPREVSDRQRFRSMPLGSPELATPRNSLGHVQQELLVIRFHFRE